MEKGYNMKKTKYVVSYIFDENNEKVLLIKKKRPVFLVGKMTGICGHVEDFDESHTHAIQREVEEESNIRLNLEQIHLIDSVIGDDYTLDVYAIIINEEQLNNFKNNIDEIQTWVSLEDIKNNAFSFEYAPGTYSAVIYIHENFSLFK